MNENCISLFSNLQSVLKKCLSTVSYLLSELFFDNLLRNGHSGSDGIQPQCAHRCQISQIRVQCSALQTAVLQTALHSVCKLCKLSAMLQCSANEQHDSSLCQGSDNIVGIVSTWLLAVGSAQQKTVSPRHPTYVRGAESSGKVEKKPSAKYTKLSVLVLTALDHGQMLVTKKL